MEDQPTEQLIRNIVKVIIYSNAILLNTWLLFVLWRDPMKRFRNSPSFIIANLALVDIVAAIGGLGSTVAIFVCKFESACVNTHILFACVQTVGLQNSFIFIALLAFDRFLAISYPYRYTMVFGNKRCHTFLCILGWAIGSTLGPLVHYLELDKQKGKQFVLYQLYIVDVTVLAVITAILYPLNYYNYLRRKRILRSSIHPNQAMEDLTLAQQLNVSSMIAATVLFTAMAPHAIILVYTLKDCFKCLIDPIFKTFWVNYQAAIPVILFINPIIYAWRLPLYRKSSMAVVKDLFKKSNKSSDKLSSYNNNSSRIVNQLTSSTTERNDVHV